MTKENQNNEVDFSQTVINVKGYLKQSAESILLVGRELKQAKDYVDSIKDAKENAIAKANYKNIYEDLPFGETVGNKFIAIYDDKMIGQYLDYLPSAYNTLYDKLRGLDQPTWTKMTSGDIFIEKEKKEGYKLKLNSTSTASEIKEMLDFINPPKEGGNDDNSDDDKSDDDNTGNDSIGENKDDPNAIVCVFQVDIQQKKISAENIKKLTALQSTAQKIIDESGLGKDVLIRLDTIKFAETNIVDDLDEQLEKVG